MSRKLSVERIVLFRVEQHLQRGRFRVALGSHCSPCQSVEKMNTGLEVPRLLQVLNDAAGHGADVGASVSAISVRRADRRATSNVFAFQRFGNRFAQGGLAHPEGHTGQMIGDFMSFSVSAQPDANDALFHLFAKMVRSECIFQVEASLAVYSPQGSDTMVSR